MSRKAPFLRLIALAAALAGCAPGAQAPAAADGAVKPPSAAVAALVPNPIADPKAEVLAAMEKFMAARSYHVAMTADSPRGAIRNEMDFVAPDRYRMDMPGVGVQTIIGDTMYLNTDGRIMKVPMPAGTAAQWRDPAGFAQARDTMTVEAQGSETVDGIPTRKYLLRLTQPQPAEMTLWIGNDRYPVQMKIRSAGQGGMADIAMRYSRIDDPQIRIEAPR